MVKNYLYICLLALIVAACSNDGKKNKQKSDTLPQSQNAPKGKITLNGSPVLLPLLKSMSEAFCAQYPSIMMEVKAENDTAAVSNVLKGKDDIYLCSGSIPESLAKFEYYHLATDVIVLAVNFNNPALQRILLRGIALNKLHEIFYKGSITSWSQLFKNQAAVPLKAYMLPNASGVDAALRNWMNAGANQWFGGSMKTEQEVLNSILNNTGGIGFIGSHLAYNSTSGFRKDGLYIIPVDLDNTNTLEDEELLYDNLKQLSGNVDKGLIPKQLIRQHYMVYNASSEHIDMIRLFIDWIKENGINYYSRLGFFAPVLPPSETTKQINK